VSNWSEITFYYINQWILVHVIVKCCYTAGRKCFMDFLREFPYALWPEKSNELNQSSVRPRIRALRSIKVGPRMDLPKFRAISFDGFLINGQLWQKNTFLWTLNNTYQMQYDQRNRTNAIRALYDPYKGATCVLRSVTLLMKHPVQLMLLQIDLPH
jgi:hypothetical protein